ncbi:hypothetical protein [Pararhizobium mangrovi]|uniref:Uncharacterized protein n=1 Tax=Pararhizobium mangrovi TaxID=2590452 RepID=A0A506TY40_9HYPH|nr:hypothetical protein [Pararhizobium mangrovi]TPW25881.1 hypothetical protein FJU11_17280 [Pararhizobium mangrovi]
MTQWRCTQLSFAGQSGHAHTHSYYDIPVFDETGRAIVAHRLFFSGRKPTSDDRIEIGIVNTDEPGSWDQIGTSSAWSWQQGPLAQWIAGGPRLIWNDAEENRHVARIFNRETRSIKTLPMPVYSVDREGRHAFSINMARLNTVRPGYGYPGGGDARVDEARPGDDGIWRMALDDPSPKLILSVSQAVDFMRRNIGWRLRLKQFRHRYVYWFNHLKLSPDGKRFTVKLRWRELDGARNDRMGVSLTCNTDGTDLRLLATATSHVIWKTSDVLYFWSEGAVREYEDRSPRGTERALLAPDLIDANVHIRHLDPNAQTYVFDTPYREKIDLFILDRATGNHERIGRFEGHTPERGEFRCDLHPCPNARGDRIVVTSMMSGMRQLYLFSWNGAPFPDHGS